MGKKAGQNKIQAVGGDDDDAILDAALQAAGAERGKAAVLSKAGQEFAANGNFEEAIGKFTEAIFGDPNTGTHYCRRSAAFLSAGRVSEAHVDAGVAANLGGQTPAESAECLKQFGLMLSKDGKLQEAHAAYQRGLKLQPNHAGCRQGFDEVTVMIERRAGGQASLALVPGDVDVQPLRTLQAPEEVLGKGFEVVLLRIGSCDKPLSFLLSTSETQEAVITPAACGKLGMPIKRTVDLIDVKFDGGCVVGDFKNCSVCTFIQAEIAEKALGTVLHGMLGLPFLKRYDLDIDRVRGEQRFKEPGAAVKGAFGLAGKFLGRVGSVHLPGVPLPGGLLGLPVHIRHKQKSAAFLGVIDTGSMFSVISWKVAKELGIASGPDDSALEEATKVVGATKTGPAEMPLVNLKVNVCGIPEEAQTGCRLSKVDKEEFDASGKGNGWDLELKVKDLKPSIEFGRINVAIGDAIQFELLSDSTVGQFNGGAMLIGQDLLAQAPRFTLSGNEQKIWMDPPGRITDASPI